MLRIVGGTYFATLGIPVIAAAHLMRWTAAGRASRRRERKLREGARRPSERWVRECDLATGLIEWEVIGVVGDVQIVALDATAPPLCICPICKRLTIE